MGENLVVLCEDDDAFGPAIVGERSERAVGRLGQAAVGLAVEGGEVKAAGGIEPKNDLHPSAAKAAVGVVENEIVGAVWAVCVQGLGQLLLILGRLMPPES